MNTDLQDTAVCYIPDASFAVCTYASWHFVTAISDYTYTVICCLEIKTWKTIVTTVD